MNRYPTTKVNVLARTIVMGAAVTSIFLISVALPAGAQVPETDIKSVVTTLTRRTPTDSGALVSSYTYSRLYAASLAKVLSFENAINTSTRYATLNLDKNKSVFDFAPFNWALQSPSNSPSEPGKLYGYFNLFISGKINTDGIAKIYEDNAVNREISIGGTFTFARGGDFFNPAHYGKDEFRKAQKKIAENIGETYTKHLRTRSADDPTEYAKRLTQFSNYYQLESAMLKDFSEIEESLAKPFWKGIWRQWLSITPKLGQHTVNVYDTTNKILSKKKYNDVSVRLGLNTYYSPTKLVAVYGSVWGEGKRKDRFSDMTPQVFNTTASVDSTTSRILDTKNVYLYDGTADAQEFLWNVGAQLVAVAYFERRPIGIDVSFSANQLIKFPGNNRRGMMYRQNYGVVFPFTDKDGNNTVNISIFYAHDTYNPEASGKASEYLGARFTVPIIGK